MRWNALLFALLFLSGCETLNETLVRQMFKDHGLSHKVGEQIWEGLERRKNLPPAEIPGKPAPPFLDQG